MRGASDGSNQAEFSAKREELGARDSLDVLTSLPQPSSFRSGLELGACPFVDLKFNRCKSYEFDFASSFPSPLFASANWDLLMMVIISTISTVSYATYDKTRLLMIYL